MIKMRGFHMVFGPVIVTGLALGCVVQAPAGLTCDAGLEARANALQGAVTSLTKVSADMKASLAVACSKMATDLGQSPPAVGDGSSVSDDTLQQVCDMANTALQDKIKQSSAVTLAVQGGRCQVAAQAQFDCETKCDVNGKCMPPTLEARCDPGELSGECDGKCQAKAVCEGSATVEVQCHGSCEATCTGSCDGACVGKCDGNDSTTTCAGKCEGRCEGSCQGTCDGDCTLDENSSINCGAEASCRGGCSVAYKAPVCEGKLKPPSCDLDADCEAGCSGQASLQATCTPPTVKVLAGGDATLVATLEQNMPAVLRVVEQSKLVAEAATDVAAAGKNVGSQLTDSAACAVEFGADFVSQLDDSVKAAASIQVSVMASVTINTTVVAE